MSVKVQAQFTIEVSMSQFKPMLASTVDLEKIKYPVLVSPKYDGVRAIVLNGVVYSRNLKPIPNKHVQELFGKAEYNGFDGELIAGSPIMPNVFNVTSSAVMSVEGTPNVYFYVFDYFLSSAPYKTRFKSIKQTRVLIEVPQCFIDSEANLLRFEKDATDLGYEGVMLRNPNGFYKYGRSTIKEGYLLKFKRFEDSEAKIFGFEELMINENEAVVNELGQKQRSSKKEGMRPSGKLGAFIVKDVKTNVSFSIGSGFTDMQRIEYWLMKEHYGGKLVKYRFQPTGVKDKPRFPVFLGFRDARDM